LPLDKTDLALLIRWSGEGVALRGDRRSCKRC
jgi:hypothetical protein